MSDTGPLALEILSGRHVFSQFAPGWDDCASEAFVRFEVDGLTAPDDWEALHLYILPGDGW